MNLQPVILAGGAGTRLWPLSRELKPKQLIALDGARTMLQATAARAAAVPGSEAAIVVCNEAHRFMIAEQLHAAELPPRAIVLEPEGRNTAPAIALAACLCDARPETVLLVLPADHVIRDTDAFVAAVQAALPAAAAGQLVTFGIVPIRPETGYGYIRKGAGSGAVVPVDRFVEKPDLDTARRYLESGEYYWNSGMFMFRVDAILAEFERLTPDILATCRAALTHARRDLDFTRIDAIEFARCRAESIDYGVMEKTDRAVTVALDAGWNDVGSWAALHEIGAADAQGNVAIGDAVLEDCRDCYVYSEGRLVAAIGLANHIVVETKDAVLVVPRERAQDVKRIVARLKAAGRSEHLLHREVFRPWGSYDSIDAGDRFQVKRLSVKPGASMSLQMHHHRAEHWIVVSGTARITRGDEEILLHENQSTYIPIGMKHRIENPGLIPLHMIEVQSGSYLGEDDIVRFEDRYGREKN